MNGIELLKLHQISHKIMGLKEATDYGIKLFSKYEDGMGKDTYDLLFMYKNEINSIERILNALKENSESVHSLTNKEDSQ